MSRKLMQRTGFASLVMEAFSVMTTMMLTVSGCNAQAAKVPHTSVALAYSITIYFHLNRMRTKNTCVQNASLQSQIRVLIHSIYMPTEPTLR